MQRCIARIECIFGIHVGCNGCSTCTKIAAFRISDFLVFSLNNPPRAKEEQANMRSSMALIWYMKPDNLLQETWELEALINDSSRPVADGRRSSINIRFWPAA